MIIHCLHLLSEDIALAQRRCFEGRSRAEHVELFSNLPSMSLVQLASALAATTLIYSSINEIDLFIIEVLQ